MLSFHRFLSNLSLFLIFLSISQAVTHHPDTSELVVKVCRQTSNYTSCVETLYSDSRTPEADRFTLADIAFRLADGKAHQGQDFITEMLKNPGRDRDALLTCQADYKIAIKAMISALNDLNSETFVSLPPLAKKTGKAAAHCKSYYPPLTSNAQELIHLCEICTVIAKLFISG